MYGFRLTDVVKVLPDTCRNDKKYRETEGKEDDIVFRTPKGLDADEIFPIGIVQTAFLYEKFIVKMHKF